MKGAYGVTMQDMSVNKGDNPVLAAAKEYIARGWSVFPIVPGGKSPAVASWKPYQERLATTEELQEWFGDGNANIAIVTGSLSGLTVLDFDTDEAWNETFRLGVPSDSPLVETSKGFHLYCRHHEAVKNDQHGQVLSGMDIRSEGGYVVAPPSVHESGARYQWFGERGPDNVGLSDLPEWVIKAERKKPAVANLEGGVEAGNRNGTLTQLLGRWVKEYTFDEVIAMALEWNNTCTPPDSEQQVIRTVQSIWEAEYAGLPDDPTGEPWDEPVLFEQQSSLGGTEIKTDMIPSFVGDYAKEVSRYNQSPEALAVMVGLSMIATCLQKKFVVSPHGDEDYLEPLNLWTVTALKPSERKTPVFNAMMNPLKQWEMDKRNDLAERMVQVANEREVLFKRLDNLRKIAANADTDEDRSALLNQINEVQVTIPDEIIAPRLWIEDITTERLQQMLADHDEKISLLSDEGGIFEILAGMYSSGKINVDVLLQAYSGTSVRIERGGRSAYLDKPALTVGLTVQPGIIRELGMGSKRKLRDNGLLARFFYCVPEGNVGSRNPRMPHRIDPVVKQAYESGIKRMLDITPFVNADGSSQPHILRVSHEAKELWYDFAEEIEPMLADGGEMGSFSDWGGKLAGNVFRVAGNYHVVKGGTSATEIDAETMQQAINLCRALIPHAKAAFGEMGNSVQVSNAMQVVSWIKKDGKREFSKRDCQHDNLALFKTVDLLEPVLRELEGRKIIRRASKKSGPGRPSEGYEVNPVLLAS